MFGNPTDLLNFIYLFYNNYKNHCDIINSNANVVLYLEILLPNLSYIVFFFTSRCDTIAMAHDIIMSIYCSAFDYETQFL